MKMTLKNFFLLKTAVVASFAATAIASAQEAKPVHPPQLDFAVTYASNRANAVNGSGQWLQGGSLELGASAWHGLGIAAKVTGATTSSIGNQGVPLSLVVVTFGPRYRVAHGKWSAYGEGLIGEADGFKSIFAGSDGVIHSANSLATQVGGGVDYTLSKHFAYRGVEAFWTRTQLPNGTTNVQNLLHLGTGLALRF